MDESIEYLEFMAWELTTKAIDFKVIYVDMAEGDHLAGLMLSELVFWTLPNKYGETKLRVQHDGEYWIAVRYQEWWDRIRLTESQAERAVRILVNTGMVVKAVYKFDGVPTVHLRLNKPVFAQRWRKAVEDMNKSCTGNVQFLPKQKSIPAKTEMNSCQNGESLTETTTETTTDSLQRDFELLSSEPTDENAQEWFLARERVERAKRQSTQQPPPKTPQEARQRVEAAVEGFARANSGKDTTLVEFVNSLPEAMRPLAEAFCKGFGRIPIGKEKAYWMSSWNDQILIGLSPKDISDAFEKMRKDGLTIKSPQSITAIAEEFMRTRRKPTGEGQDGLLSPVTGPIIRSTGSQAKLPFG